MKNAIKALLQKLLGYRRYLRLFAWFKVKTLHNDRREEDFFAFLNLLPPDGIVLDIGANLGFITAHLSKRVRNGRIIAFEPMPDNLDALQYVVRKFKLPNVKVEEVALGDHDGEVEMVLPVEGSAKQQGLSHIVHEQLVDHNKGIRFKVPLKKLDSLSYLFEPGVQVTGIKMDVENFEHFVLSGADQLIAKHHPLLYLELWPNENRTKCFQKLAGWNYEITVHENGAHVKYNAATHAERINFLAVPAGYTFGDEGN